LKWICIFLVKICLFGYFPASLLVIKYFILIFWFWLVSGLLDRLI
jgi:hypothetical protein